MLELQEKLRKSEEERMRLEQRFSLLEQESRIRHVICINKLRACYIEYLEQQRARDERNHKLLGTLDKIDTNLAVMTAKTDRLAVLRREYEASILRSVANQRQAASITGDSGVVSQNDDKFRQIRSSLRTPMTSANENDRIYHRTAPVRSTVLGNSNAPTPRRIFHDTYLSSPVKYSDTENYRSSLNFQSTQCKPTNHRWDYASKYDLTTTLKQDIRKNVLPRDTSSFQCPEFATSSRPTKLTNILATATSSRAESAGHILENELECYINRIRNLHAKDDPASFEEIDHEQNTSGDLLNVTLSDDGFEHLPVEEKMKTRVITAQVENVLNIADDLISRTNDNPHIATEIIEKSTNSPASVVMNASDSEPIDSTQTDVKDEINVISATISPIELDHTSENSESAAKLNHINDNPQNPAQTSDSHCNDVEAHEISTNNSEKSNLYNNQQEEIDCEAVNQLQSTNVENVEDINLNESQLESHVSHENENNESENRQIEEVNNMTNNETQEINGQAQDNYENYEQQPIDENYVYDGQQEYSQDPNQMMYEYNNEQYNINQEYQYDPNTQYPQYDQQYNEQYENQQYEQYTDDPNQQYQTETHIVDENQSYDYNQEANFDTTAYDDPQAHQSAEDQHSEPVKVSNDQPGENRIEEFDEKKSKNIIKSILDSDTESTIEKNSVSNTESDFNFN